MAKLIRCPAGHVYDSTTHDACPECARTTVPEAEGAGETAPVRDSESRAKGADRKPAQMPWLAVGGAALVLLAIAGFFLLRPSGEATKETPQSTAESTPSASADAKSDPDYQTCDAGSGDGVIPACDRAIASGHFSGVDLATLYRDRAIERTSKDDLDGAIADYTEALRLDPRNIAAFNDRGELYRRKGEYDRAIEDYDQAIALDPKQPVPINNRGLAYASKGEHDRAIADFDEAIGLDPASAKYLANRGNAYRAKGAPERAKDDYAKALALNPDADQKRRIEAALAEIASGPPAAPADAAKREASGQPEPSAEPAAAPDASSAAGASAPATAEPAAGDPKSDPDYQACVKTGESTIDACDKAIASGKFSGSALASLYTGRGAGQMAKKNYDAAVSDFSEAIELDPNQPNAYSNRGAAFRQKGDREKALGDLDQAIKLDSKYAPAFNNRGLVYADQREYDRAIQDFSQAIGLDPNYLKAYKNRGDAYRRKGEKALATADYNKALALNPSDDVKKQINAALYALGSAPSAAPAPPQAEAQTADQSPAPASGDTPTQARAPEPATSTADPNSDPDYQTCEKFIEGGTVEACSRAIASGKFGGNDLAELYFFRGGIALTTGNTDPAIADFSEAVRINPSSTNLSNLGIAYKQKGDYDKALQKLDQAIALNPKNKTAFENRGVTYYAKGDYGQAIEDLGQAIAFEPDDPILHKLRGDAYAKKGDRDRAAEDYKKALTLKPDEEIKAKIETALKELDSAPAGAAADKQAPPQPAASTADPKSDPDYQSCVQFLESPAEAAAACSKAIASGKFGGGDLAVLYSNRAVWMEMDGDVAAAIADSSEAIRLAPGSANNFNNRGTMYLSKGDYDKAIQDFNQAIALDPKHQSAFRNRGIAYANKGDRDRAIEDLSQAIAFEPGDPFLHKLRGDAYAKKGDRDRAAEDYNKALTLKPDEKIKAKIETALKELDSAPAGGATEKPAQPQPAASTADPKSDPDYQACARPKGDAGACDRAIASGGFSGVDLGTLYRYRAFGRAHGEKPDIEGALADYTEAVRLDPQSFIPFALRSEVYRDKGDFESEVKDLDQAIALNPRADLYDQRGNALRKLGKLDRALEDLNQAIKLDPGYFGSYWNRALAYQAKGDREHAAEDYEKALTLKPNEEARKKIEAALKGLGSSSAATPPEQAAPKPAANEKTADDGGQTTDDFMSCIKKEGNDAGAACDRAIASGKFSGGDLANLYISRGFMPASKMPEKKKSLDAALADFDEAVKLDPSKLGAFVGRGRTYIEMRDYDRGLKDIDEALKLDPKSASALHWRGVAYAGQKNYDRAIEAFDQALQLDAKLLMSYFFRARSYTEKGDRERAIADYKMALTLDPDDQLRRIIEKSLEKLDKKSEAPSSGRERSAMAAWGGRHVPQIATSDATEPAPHAASATSLANHAYA